MLVTLGEERLLCRRCGGANQSEHENPFVSQPLYSAVGEESMCFDRVLGVLA